MKNNLAYIIRKISREGAKSQRTSRLTNLCSKIQISISLIINILLIKTLRPCLPAGRPASLRDELFRLAVSNSLNIYIEQAIVYTTLETTTLTNREFQHCIFH